MTLNADLSKMSYDEFKTFIQGIALLYSDVNSHHNFISLYNDLGSVAKHIDRPPLDFFTIYGAYEISDNQVVLAVFSITMEYPEDDNVSPHISNIDVSFAENTTHLRCPLSVRDLLTQHDYVSKAEQAFPRIMAELLEEKAQANRKSTIKLSLTKEQRALMEEWGDDDIKF